MNNKITTRDNLKKRNLNKPKTCVCHESVQHLFFDCIVARLIWSEIAAFFGKLIGANLDSLAHYWIANDNHAALNSICIAMLWSIWSLINDIIFNGVTWLSMKHIWWIILRTTRTWRILFKESMMASVESFGQHFHKSLLVPPLMLMGG
jgi:uncharacterized membrane protein